MKKVVVEEGTSIIINFQINNHRKLFLNIQWHFAAFIITINTMGTILVSMCYALGTLTVLFLSVTDRQNFCIPSDT